MINTRWIPFYDRRQRKTKNEKVDNPINCGRCLEFHEKLICDGKNRCIYK